MSKYTTELRFVCASYSRPIVESWFKDYELSDYLTPAQIETIENAGIWNKSKLARKIVDHYFMREIGCETPALFKLYAKVYMQEIMERKLPLIYSASINYDPLVNVDYTESFERSATGSATSSSTNNGSGLAVNSDTPQGQISKEDILNGTYATSTGASESTSNINDNSNTSNAENYTKRVKGNSGVSATAQKMVQQFRENIIAIDEDIIKELNKLFMGIY